MENTHLEKDCTSHNNMKKIILFGGPLAYITAKVYLYAFYTGIGASTSIVESDNNALNKILN